MVLRLVFVTIIGLISLKEIYAGTLTFLHGEKTEVKLRDAVYPDLLAYAPTFQYPSATIFQLKETDFPFYSVKFNSKEYYLWVEDPSVNTNVNLENLDTSTASYALITKSNWLNGKIDSKIGLLKKVFEIDSYYANALDSLNNLAETNEQYRYENSFSTIVWDSRSAKRLYNFAVESFSYQIDENLIHYIPESANYWQLLYKLYYQYYHTNSFKGLNKKEIKFEIETDFPYPQSKSLVFHHFFHLGLSLNDLKENYELFETTLTEREKMLAEAYIQKQAIKDLSNKQKIDFLFGIDIDGAMEGYFARDSSEKKQVLIFWSTWDTNMASEFNLLLDLKESFKEHYNFIHICIDAYETPEKTKAFIYQNRVGGFHLLPEQSSAFRKSNFRKNEKIRDFPFYLLTDNYGNIIETEPVPLEISSRLENKLKYFSTKK